MNGKDDGGYAFPTEITEQISQEVCGMRYTVPVKYQKEGMTLLDWFAGQALPALLKNSPKEWDEAYISECAYSIGEAMIEQKRWIEGGK